MADLTPADARRIIYRSLMAGGAHTPERSEKATATIEALLYARNAEIEKLTAQVARARAFATEMRGYCSPVGVASLYADRLDAALTGPSAVTE